MPLLQNQSNGPAPVISTVQRDLDSGGSMLPFAIASLVIALLGAVVFGYRLLSLQAKTRDVTTQISQLTEQYNSLSDVKARVANISALAKGLEVVYAAQSPIADLINTVESTSFKPAVYSTVSIDKRGEVRISGTVPTYRDFAKVVKSFKGSEDGVAGVTDAVTIDSVSQSVSSGEGESAEVSTKFSISFIMRPVAMGTEVTP